MCRDHSCPEIRSGRHPMDLYVSERYLAAVERVSASRSFFSWVGDSRGGMS
jgi:hypothetical protein